MQHQPCKASFLGLIAFCERVQSRAGRGERGVARPSSRTTLENASDGEPITHEFAHSDVPLPPQTALLLLLAGMPACTTHGDGRSSSYLLAPRSRPPRSQSNHSRPPSSGKILAQPASGHSLTRPRHMIGPSIVQQHTSAATKPARSKFERSRAPRTRPHFHSGITDATLGSYRDRPACSSRVAFPLAPPEFEAESAMRQLGLTRSLAALHAAGPVPAASRKAGGRVGDGGGQQSRAAPSPPSNSPPPARTNDAPPPAVPIRDTQRPSPEPRPTTVRPSNIANNAR